jgi:hypothetical protein
MSKGTNCHKCVEAAPDAAPTDAGADKTEARAAAPLSLPPLNMLAKNQTLSEEEIWSWLLAASSEPRHQGDAGDAPLVAPRRRQGSAAQRQVQADARASLKAELPCHGPMHCGAKEDAASRRGLEAPARPPAMRAGEPPPVYPCRTSYSPRSLAPHSLACSHPIPGK